MIKLGKLHIDPIEYGSQGNAILGIRDSGKALALDTPLPTPTGWTTMGKVEPGDQLFDEDGHPCTVLSATEIQRGRKCYAVTFSDGSKIVADEEHLWLTESYAARCAERNARVRTAKGYVIGGRADRPQCVRLSFPSLVTTREMKDTLIAGAQYKEKNHAIRNAAPLVVPKADLPIDPYTLGCWLGDGTSVNATITSADPQVLECISAEGYRVTPAYKNPTTRGQEIHYRIREGHAGVPLHKQLREIGLLGNKTIPPIYLRASQKQRMALLQGLMDTDGTVQRGSNSCVFYNTNKNLADGVYELVCSLGWKATLRTKRSMLNGVDYGTCFEIRFRPTIKPFRLARKANLMNITSVHEERRLRRVVTSVEEVESVPVRCITVSSESRLFLCGRAMIPTHNSYTATFFAEQLFEAGIPFIAFDPIGIWRFLRIPGKGRGYPIVVAGGKDGDLPLSVASAPEIVRAAMQNGVSLVIDLFDINLSKADWRRIVAGCIRVLLHENQAHGLRHVFLEEAAEFIPQKPTDFIVYAEIEKMARMGGNSRLGYTLINQRSQEVAKAILELCENVFLHRQRGKNALENMDKWLAIAGATEQKNIIAALPEMPQGQCFAWIGGDTPQPPMLVKVPTKHSLHPDRRVMRGDQIAGAKPAIDVSAFVKDMRSGLVKFEEEAKANDPALLRAEIARLKKDLSRNATPLDPQALVLAEGQGYNHGFSDGIEATKNALAGKIRDAALAVESLLSGVHPIANATRKATALIKSNIERHKPVPKATNGASINLPKGERAVLIAVAQHPNGVTRQQLTALTGYKRSTRDAYTQRLRERGHVEDGERITASRAGIAALGSNYEPLPTGDALQAHIMPRLPEGERNVLEIVIQHYPQIIDRTLIDAKTNYARSSRDAYLQRLLARELITTEGRGGVRASDMLFG